MSIDKKGLVKLATALSRQPSQCDGEKLGLVGLEIREIDLIPTKISEGVQVLYLSENYISSLAGIDQFKHLATLSIMNNHIRYLDELQPLSRLAKLQKISLVGNLVVKMPYYREHVIVLCPCLTSLDGEQVTAVERASATSMFYKIRAFYDQLRLNELRNCVMVHISKLMTCQVELRKEVFGKFR
jgi:hypothetical protein